MPLVVFLKGINVGGHRRFRPAELVRRLKRLDIVNIGAAGTFVVRGRIGRLPLRAEIARRADFDLEIMICDAREILEMIASEPFAGRHRRAELVHFVSVMGRRRSRPPSLPAQIPASGRWSLKPLGRHGRFVFGVHRREMKAIAALGDLETLLATPLTTRSWSTFQRIASAIES